MFSRAMIAFGLLACLALGGERAHAALDVPPGVSQAQFDALAALIPTPAATVPPAEAVAGAAGATMTFRRGDAVQPRISRSATFVTTSGGVISGTWNTALASTPNIIFTPIWGGTGSVNCFLTATPTTTTFTGKCTVDQSAVLGLSIVTAGLTVGPLASAAGMSVQVIALPSSQ